MANSDRISGAGLLAGYSYGEGFYIDEPHEDYGQKAIELADNYSAQGKIANTDNLNGQNIYILAGKNDPAVKVYNANAENEFYTHFQSNVKFDYLDGLSHTLATDTPVTWDNPR